MKNYSFKYRVLNKINQWGVLKFFNFKTAIRINNHRFIIPIINGIGFTHLVSQENWMIKVLESHKNDLEGKYFIDIGVNIGQTMLKVYSVSSSCNYLGFEPNPFCISYLLNLISANKFNNITIVPAALSESTDSKELLFDNESNIDSSASIIEDYRAGSKRKVNILTLKPENYEAFQNIKIGIIKIDVEGAELEVLKGLESIISNNRPAIIIEILPVYSEKNLARLKRMTEIVSLIKKHNYIIYRINEQSGDLEKINNIDIHSDLSHCNYFLKPE